jgi:hypothetical protein
VNLKNRKVVFALLLLAWTPVLFAQSIFSADSVYDHIRYLTEEIGPRPMGSEREWRALEWVAGKFRSYGADTAYVMPFTQVAGKEFDLNTSSGIAVGLFHGASDTALTVGGHADSTPDESPGANDNASGTATAIELARIWSQRPRRYTMIFFSFGGEERGLYGSQFFADHYTALDSIGLMISADMTGGAGDMTMIFEDREAQTPRWLVQDALRINREMGFNFLQYPTHFSTINSLAGGAGSDHEPFLAVGIPAIDFTTGLNTSPIHTALDNLANIDRGQLDRSGRFIDALLSQYQQQGLPGRKLEHYTLWSPFGYPLFIPHWILVLVVVTAFLLGVLAFIHSRKQRVAIERSLRVRFSPAKLALLFLIVAGVAQSGEGVIQALKGMRYPWLVHVVPYLLLMICWAIGGLWLALWISRHWRWNREPHLYASRTLILLALLTIAASFASARLAIYPGLGLLFFALAVLLRPQGLKLIFGLLTPLPVLRLVFTELTVFIGRNMAMAGMNIDAFWKAALYTAAITMILLGLFLPFINSGAWMVLRIPWLRRSLRRFRRPVTGLAVLLLLVLATGAAYRLPAYDASWRPAVQLAAKYTLPKGESELLLRGSDYFQDVRVQNDTLDLRFSERSHNEKLAIPFTADWVMIEGSEVRHPGEQDTILVDWRLQSLEPWQSVTLAIKTDTLKITEVQSALKYRLDENELSFTWLSRPPDSLTLQARFLVHPGSRLIREVTATYNRPPLPIEVSSAAAAVSYRTRVIRSDTLRIGDGRGGA